MLAGLFRSDAVEKACSASYHIARQGYLRHVTGITLRSCLAAQTHTTLRRPIAKQQSVHACITRWSSFQSTPRNMRDLCTLGLDQQQRISHTSLLRRELCVRLAQSAAQLRALPHGWADRHPFQEIIDSHNHAIHSLESCPCPPDAAQDQEVTDVFKSVFEDLKVVGSVPNMLRGLQELIGELGTDGSLEITPQVNKIILNFFTLRTGLRFLIQHHVESCQGRKFGFSGSLELKCSPAKIAKSAARDSSLLCRAALGQVPRIVVTGAVHESLPYVPAVLQYVLTEIFKNACRAVVERHRVFGYDDNIPPVQCEIESTSESLTISVRDAGCGMSREQQTRMWDFLYTTTSSSPWNGEKSSGDNKSQGVLAGYGVGLPLSRMYARYFGGDLKVSSQEGRGTEVRIILSRAAFCSEVLPSSAHPARQVLPSNAHEDFSLLNMTFPGSSSTSEVHHMI